MLRNGKFTLKHPLNHLVIICRHSDQNAYLQLTQMIEKVTFFRLGERISEAQLVALCALEDGKSTGVLFDDVEHEREVIGLTQLLVSAAVRLSHHLNIICLISLHSIFHNHEFYRLLQKNSQYYIFTRQIRERGSLQNLSRQIFGGAGSPGNLLSDAFRAFCEKSHPGKEEFSGLILDLNAKTPSKYRIRESFDIRKELVCYQSLKKDAIETTVQVKYPLKIWPKSIVKN